MKKYILRRSAAFLLLLFTLHALAACEQKAERPTAIPHVRYMVVTGEELPLTTELPGRVAAFMTSDVRPQVSGIVQKRLFEEGADVEAGQVLYQIDPALFAASYNNAKATVAKAEANALSARLLAERYGKIIRSNAVSRQEYDDALAAHAHAKAEVEAAQQALETARINLGYTEVKAPVSGRIGRSYITPGALVTQNQAEPMATIQHLDTVYVDLTQSSNQLLKLRRAVEQGDMQSGGLNSAKVRLKLEDGTPYARPVKSGEEPQWIEGDLLFSEVIIEKSTGVVNLRAKFENPGKVLLPGMYVRAEIEEGRLSKAVVVPQKTVLRDTRGQAYVYVLQEDKDGSGNYVTERRMVEIDRNIGNKWLISSGLKEGERLLVDGHLKTRPGLLVSASQLAPEEMLSAGKAAATTMR